MARGRILSKAICVDKRVNDLASFESMLAFTWLISHLDVLGRTFGDPAIVRSMVFPRRSDVSVEQMEGFIQEWHDAGLVIWYRANDDLFLQFPGFEKNQPGLNAEREAASTIPDAEEVMSYSGVTQEQNAIKFKLKFKLNNNINSTGENSEIPDIEQDTAITQFRKVWEDESRSMVAAYEPFAKMVTEFERAGVTPEIYRQAIQEQKRSTYPVKNPTSVQSWAIGIVKERDKPKKPRAEPAGTSGNDAILEEIRNGKF